MLFLPGYFSTAWAFECYLPFFAERGYPGFALNFRGHAGSELPPATTLGAVSLHDYIDDGRAAVRWLTDRFGPPIVVGHSMGGLIAQKLGEEQLARALILLSPVPPRGISMMSGRLFRRQLRFLPAILRSKAIVPRWSDARALVLNCVPESEKRTIFEQFVPDSGRAGREMSLGTIAVDAERLRSKQCPLLVVTSDDDRMVPARVAQRVAAKYRAPVYIARGHGHFVVREPGWSEPASFIDGWLKRELAGG